MEQQNSLQSVITADIQKQPDPEPMVAWNEESCPIEFRHGMYYCNDLEGGYLTRDTLKHAWRVMMSKKKIAEAEKERHGAYSGPGKTKEEGLKIAQKAIAKKKKWSNP